MVFQDPMMTLNPVLRIDTQMVEAVLAHQNVDREAARAQSRASARARRHRRRPRRACAPIRTSSPAACASAWRSPSRCSTSRKLIIADEPTTALDVTIQAQILYEAQKLCRESGTALIWITHDLSVVAGLADRICVMYAGRIVEQGTVDEVLDAPLHPYTQGLIGSVPSRNRRGQPLAQIPGMTPALLEPAAGLRVPQPLPARRARPAREDPQLEPHGTGWCAASTPCSHEAAARDRARLQALRRSRSTSPGRSRARLGADVSDEVVHAVDDVSFTVDEGEVVGLVGESGCGKSTLGRMVAGILPPSAGAIRYRGQDRGDERGAQVRRCR